MIWHFVEVWLFISVAFAIGCAAGGLLYGGIARTPLAPAQGMVADALGDAIDNIKTKFGLGPDWREGFRPTVDRPSRYQRAEAEPERPVAHIEPRAPSWVTEVEYEGDRPAARDWDDDEEWIEEEDYVLDRDGEAILPPAQEQLTLPPGDELLAATGDVVAKRPAGLAAPRNGVPDNLLRIRGVGKRNEELLHGLGVFHFGQIAAWTPAEIQWVSAYLAFPDRIERDDWVGQAIVFASGGDTGFSKASSRRRERRMAAREPEEGA